MWPLRIIFSPSVPSYRVMGDPILSTYVGQMFIGIRV